MKLSKNHWLKASQRLPLALTIMSAAVLLLTLDVRSDTNPLLAAVSSGNYVHSSFPAILQPCTPSEDLFPKARMEEWNDIFRAQALEVMDSDEEPPLISCKDNAREMATPELRSLADKLPRWQEKNPLYQNDIGGILLDYLDAYGCALKDAEIHIVQDIQSEGIASSIGLHPGSIAQKVLERLTTMQENLDIARETVKRSLLILVSSHRIDPLDRSFTCLDRTSKDLRNLFGLAADAGACLPIKTWDARQQLRHYPAP